MLSNFQLSSRLMKENVIHMDTSKNTVSNKQMLEEWEIVQAAQKNPAKFRPLYNKYYEQIFRFIYRRTSEEFIAADVCSQVFLKAIQKLDKYEFKGVPFSAWLYRIASNEIAQHYRDVKKNRVVCVEEHQFKDIIDEVEEQPNEMMRTALLEHLDELKISDLELIELRFFEKRSFKEIANIVGITESNAKVKTYRILERIKKTLLKRKLNDPNL